MDLEELLPPRDLQSNLQTQVDNIRHAINLLNHNLTKVPEGRLRISKSNGNIQYYHVSNNTNTRGTFIPQDNIALAKELAQKSYNESALKELHLQLQVMSRFLSQYKPERIDELYTSCHQARQALINPLRFPSNEYITMWQDVQYSKNPMHPEEPSFTTFRRDQVRSKSEVIIANTLTQMGIPYRYEYPHRFKVTNGGKVKTKVFHPDFTCLNVKQRREIIWEHFGLMDNVEYSRNAFEKIDIYEQNGFYYGEKLIFTKEFSDKPLNPAQVQQLAEKFLL